MTMKEFKKYVKENFLNKAYCYITEGSKIVDIHTWTNETSFGTDYFYSVITISENHVVSKFHGWLNEDNTLETLYDGCL